MTSINLLQDLLDEFRSQAESIDDEVVKKEYVGKVVQRGYEICDVIRYDEETREIVFLNRLKVELKMDVDRFFFKPVKVLGVGSAVKTFAQGKGKIS